MCRSSSRRQFQQANQSLRMALKYRGSDAWRVNVLVLLGYANHQLRLPLEAFRFYKEALSRDDKIHRRP